MKKKDKYLINQKKLIIVTTVPETLAFILKNQPRFLAKHFNIILISSPGNSVIDVKKNESLPFVEVLMVRGINPVQDIISIYNMVKVLAQYSPDIVHSYTPKAGLITMIAALICKVPIRIHTFTGLIFPTSTGLKRCILIMIDRLICACATNIIPEGQGVKNDLINFKITRKKLKIIGYGNIAGVNTNHFNPFNPKLVRDAGTLRTKLKIPTNSFVFTFIGRLNKDKGLEELISAFSALQAESNSHLLLIGPHDDTNSINKDLLKRIDNMSRIHLLGILPDIRPALLVTNVLVLPSYREGFPNVLLEAGAMLVPVIATNVNGSNEIIEPGINGWLVSPRDTSELFEAMFAATLTSRAVLLKMGLFARHQIKRKFERKNHLARMLIFYESFFENE